MLDQTLGRDGHGGEIGIHLGELRASRNRLGERVGTVEKATESLSRWRSSVVALGGVALLVLGALIKIAADRLFGSGG